MNINIITYIKKKTPVYQGYRGFHKMGELIIISKLIINIFLYNIKSSKYIKFINYYLSTGAGSSSAKI